MAEYSLFDLLGGSGSQPARYDIYDQPNVGPTPVLQQPQPQADQGWTAMLGNLAKTAMASRGAQGQPGGGLQAARASSSSKGLLSNSRQGLDVETVMKIAAALYGGGAFGGAGAGAMGGEAGMGPGATAAASGGGGMGGMFGGGGGASSSQGGLNAILGGYQGKDVGRPTFTDVPVNRSPLVPQGVNAFDVPTYSNWLFQ